MLVNRYKGQKNWGDSSFFALETHIRNLPHLETDKAIVVRYETGDGDWVEYKVEL